MIEVGVGEDDGVERVWIEELEGGESFGAGFAAGRGRRREGSGKPPRVRR